MFEKVLVLEPDYFDAQLALGQLEETAGHPDIALRWLRPACRRRPSDTEARYSLALSLQVVGRKRRDAAAWPPTGTSEPGLSMAGAIGWAARRASAELALSEASHHFRFVADAQQAMQRVQVWTDIIRSEPRNADLRFKIGNYLMKYDNPEHGLGWLLSVLDIDPNHPPTHRMLEEYYRGQGKIERAELHGKMASEADEAEQDSEGGPDAGGSVPQSKDQNDGR